MGLLLYRWFRNRSTRMQKRFVSKIRKLSEVQAILVRGVQITVIVDKAEAKIYLRVDVCGVTLYPTTVGERYAGNGRDPGST